MKVVTIFSENPSPRERNRLLKPCKQLHSAMRLAGFPFRFPEFLLGRTLAHPLLHLSGKGDFK